MSLNGCDVITSANVDARLEELNVEFKRLHNFKKDFLGTSTEWDAGVTFVKDGYLPEHIKMMAGKCLDLDSWPLKHVDWKKAVEDYIDKKKFKSVCFGNIIYWNVNG
ncbi:MAG: hypothetical protein IMF11_18350 [Proteobacteria bacterium]|nr:hypothetical protein [Pseudomonadota bacterium]